VKTKKTIKNLLLGLILLLTTSSCENQNWIKEELKTFDSGNLENFSKIQNDTILTLQVIPSTGKPRVEAIIPPSLLEDLDIINQNDILEIKLKPNSCLTLKTINPATKNSIETYSLNSTTQPKNQKCKHFETNKTLVVRIYSDETHKISNLQSGNIDLSEFKSKYLKIINEGQGNINFVKPSKIDSLIIQNKGNGSVMVNKSLAVVSDSVDITNQGKGDVGVIGIRSKQAKVNLLGTGDITLGPTEKIEGTVAGRGFLHLSNKPNTDSLNILDDDMIIYD
jgi:hypothetical protein